MSITFMGSEAGEVNFANSNALLLLAAMSIEPDYSGRMPAEEFIHRAWTAYTSDDLTLSRHVRRTTVEQGERGAVLYDCGLDLAEIRSRLLRLAALSNGGEITWG